MQRRKILDRVVSIVKMIGKRGETYRGTGSSEAVSTLCDEKVDHETFLETVLLLAKYDNILKCHLGNVIKKYLQNKPDKHRHNRANRNTFISKTTVNSMSQTLFGNPKGSVELGNPNTCAETKLCLIISYSGSRSSLL